MSAQVVLVDPEPQASALFGVSLAAGADRLVVGAMWGDAKGGTDAGEVLSWDGVYGSVQGSVWPPPQFLWAPLGSPEDYFGNDLALGEAWLAVTSYHADIGGATDRGAVDMFEEVGGSWVHRARLLASDGEEGDYFGSNAAIDGATMVVTARYDDSGAVVDHGSAYIFLRGPQGDWAQAQKLIAAQPANADSFGFYADIAGDEVFVGANWDDAGIAVDQGSVTRFHRDAGGPFVLAQTILAPDGQAHDEFGIRVEAEGAFLFVGAPGAAVDGELRGAAYAFRRGPTGEYEPAGKLVAADGATYDGLGSSIAAHEGIVAVGAWAADSPPVADTGAVHIFRRNLGGEWVQLGTLRGAAGTPPGATGAFLGTSVALSDGLVFAGAYAAPVAGATSAGAVAIFAAPKGADLNMDGVVDGADLGHLLTHFGSTESTAADIDFSGEVDAADLAILMANWG